MIVTVSLASVNSVLLLALLVLYGRIVIKSKATYAIGLMIFALLLLAQNLLAVFAFVAMEPYFASEPFRSCLESPRLSSLV